MPISLQGLDDKWRTDSPDRPPCAICGKLIGLSEEDEERIEDELYEPEVPIRIFRRNAAGIATHEMAFHEQCARERGIL